MATDLEGDFDPQDQSEVFDEDNQSLDGAGDISAEMRTFEEMPDVIDVTSAIGDADDDAALIAEELDDDEIIELEADADMADIEDDELSARMPEAFDDDDIGPEDIEEVYHAEEAGLDVRDEADEDMGELEAEGASDEVELEFMGDMDAAPDIDARDAAVMEADTLADDDLEELGYPGEEEPAQDSESARAQRSR